MKAKSTAPEFSRPLQVDRVPRKGSHEHIVADAAECAKLAERFAIRALHKLSARLFLVSWRGGGIKVTGSVEAEMEQASVVSLETFTVKNQFQVERFFLPANKLNENIEDDADPIDNGIIDLGEIVAETLGLEIEPYPRKPGESFSEHQ